MPTIGKRKDDNKPIEIDLPRLIETRLLVQANSGGGKSWLLRRLLEQTHGKVQQIVLDLEGEFSTLREKYDYLLIGKDGDIPIQLKIAQLLPKRLLEHHASAIIDLYELKHHERIMFVRRFLDTLVNLPKTHWHPCLIIVDEAHIFCPEKGKSESMGSVIDLCTRGRKRGYCAILATQRLSKLHKDAAAECNNKLIGRTGLDVDMKRVSDELGFTSKAQALKLRELDPGEFFAFGPAISRSIIKIMVGNVQTIHPKPGSRHLVSTPPATSKIKKILSKLIDLPKEAEEELKTVEDLKRKIRELKIELRKKPKPEQIVDQSAIRRTQMEIERKYKTHIAELRKDCEYNARKMNGYIKGYEQIGLILNKFLENPIKIKPTPTLPKGNSIKIPAIADPQSQSKDQAPTTPSESAIPLRAGAMKMLKAAAMFHPKEITRQQIATVAGFSAKGGTFNTYLSELKRNGWITESYKRLQVTDDGLEAAGDVDPLPTDSESIIEMWAGKFRQGAARMLRTVAERYPEPITKDELGELTDFTPSGGTFNTYLSELRRNNLIKVNGTEIIATKELFLED